MKKKRSFRKELYCSVVVFLSLFVVCSSNLYAANDLSPNLQESKEGTRAPKFTRTIDGKKVTIDGKKVNIANSSNQYVVLNFSDLSSEQSREVHAEIAQLEKKYPSSKVAFVDVSIDENPDVAKQLGVSSAPAIFIIGPDRCIFTVKTNSAEIEEILNKLLK